MRVLVDLGQVVVVHVGVNVYPEETIILSGIETFSRCVNLIPVIALIPFFRKV